MGSSPETLWETLTPIRWLNWIFGHGIFVVGGHPRPIFSAIYIGTAIFGYLVFIICHMSELTENMTTYLRISFMSTLFINGVVILFSVGFSWVNEKHFQNILVRCEEINKTLKPFGMGEDYGEMSRNIKLSLTAWFVFVTVLCGTSILYLYILNEMDIVRAILLSFSVDIPIFMNNVVQLNFIGVIRCLDKKLCKINSLMSEISEAENFNRLDMKQHQQLNRIGKITIAMSYNTRKNFTRHLLGTLKQVHLEIIRISRMVNKVFCGQIMLDFIEQLVLIIGGLYNIYFEITSPSLNESATNVVLVILCFWVFLSAAKLVTINNMCEMSINKTEIMGQLIRELDCLFTDQDIKEEIQQFSLQLVLHPLYFTASNFICLRNKFTTTFCGTVTTYLVILIEITTTQVTSKTAIRIVNN